MITFAKKEQLGVLFWAGRKVFSLEKEDIFQQQLQDAASLHFWWAELSLEGENNLGMILPNCSLPSYCLSHSSAPFSQLLFPTSPKLGVFGQLLSLCSGMDDCCWLSGLKPNQAPRCAQQFKFFKSTFELDK